MHQHSTYAIDSIDDNEILLGKVFKHPFGIITVYLQAVIGILLALTLAYILLPSVLADRTLGFTIASIFAIVSIVLAVVIMAVATLIYRQSHIVITDKNITQVIQEGLFKRKISQLTMANVEDVTSEQRGFFPSILNFGVLKIETAGEQANFHFLYCPRPNYYAKIILEAREKFISQEFPYANAVQGRMPTHKGPTA